MECDLVVFNNDDFDVIPPEFGRKLRTDSFRIIQMVCLVAEDPYRYAHYLENIKQVADDMQGYTGELGMFGSEQGVPNYGPSSDTFDIVFDGVTNQLKNVIRQKITAQNLEEEEYDDTDN